MKTTAFANVLALLIAVVSAQFVFPLCADSCALTSYKSSGCLMTDYKCICNSIPFRVAFVKCFLGACNQSQAVETHNAAANFCALYGVTLPSEGLGSAVSVVASTPATVATAVTTIVEVHTTASVTTVSTAGISTAGGSAPTVYITEVINNNPATTAGTPASTDTSTGGVAKISGSGFAAAAAIGVALFIL